MRILVIKTSSLGDVIHALPAVSDAARAINGLVVDWAVERDFAAIPAWHPAVDQVIPVDLRAWRKRPLASLARGELGALRAALRRRRYDAVIDAQGLLKSAALAALAGGARHGLGFTSAREGIAAIAYRHRHHVAKGQHAIARNRALFAAALGYRVPGEEPDYGLSRDAMPASGLASPYVVLLHGTTWATKQWPDARWRALAGIARAQGYAVYAPAHGIMERARAEAIVAGLGQVLPEGDVAAAGAAIAGAAGVVAVDTGLAHLAAAFGVPTVTLYGATSPALTGTLGRRQLQRAASGMPCIPCRSRTCSVLGRAAPPPCLDAIAADDVWPLLAGLIARTGAS